MAGRIAGDAAGLPLDGGRITCLTCHTHHGAGSDTPRPHFLRAAPAELCARCHFADGAWDRAHANYPDTVHGGVWLAGPDGPPADPQEISRRCLVCHAAGHGQAGTAAAPPINIEVSHPLAVYAQLAGPGYRPADQLGPAVRLFDGRIGCASCHRVYSRHAALLSTAPQKQLCTSCHDFDGQIARR
ncbi:MAG: hypothetical protein KBD01_10535 [Acidobacteria bacterium]|nr:hypothetical protein [Acidobacteriota bacterium]